jgi:hypothetical protein
MGALITVLTKTFGMIRPCNCCLAKVRKTHPSLALVFRRSIHLPFVRSRSQRQSQIMV